MGNNNIGQQIGQNFANNVGGIAAATTSGLFSVFGAKKANKRNIENWKMQNEYNSPKAQMERFKEAGLNPNLIYGQGNSGNAAAPPPTEKPDFKAPQMQRPLQTQLQYQDVELKGATTDNLRKQGAVLIQDAALRAVQVANAVLDGRSKKVTAEVAEELKQNSLDLAAQVLRNAENVADTSEKTAGIAAVDYDIKSRTKEAEIRRISTEASKAASQLKGIDLDNKLKDLDRELKSIGIMPTDKIYFRILGRYVDNFEQFIKSLPKR